MREFNSLCYYHIWIYWSHYVTAHRSSLVHQLTSLCGLMLYLLHRALGVSQKTKKKKRKSRFKEMDSLIDWGVCVTLDLPLALFSCHRVWFGFYGILTFVGYLFNAKSIFYKWTVQFQTIQFSISTQFKCKKYFYFKLFSFVKQF